MIEITILLIILLFVVSRRWFLLLLIDKKIKFSLKIDISLFFMLFIPYAIYILPTFLDNIDADLMMYLFIGNLMGSVAILGLGVYEEYFTDV